MFLLEYIAYKRLSYDTGSRYVPFLYLVFLVVTYRSQVVAVYQRITYREYSVKCVGQYGIAHISSVPPRPNSWVCPGTHLSSFFFVYNMRWPRRSYTCTSYISHTFRSSFGRTARFKVYCQSTIGAAKPILIASMNKTDFSTVQTTPYSSSSIFLHPSNKNISPTKYEGKLAYKKISPSDIRTTDRKIARTATYPPLYYVACIHRSWLVCIFTYQ